MITVDEIKSLLNLKLHPEEGGYFVETNRSHQRIPKESISSGSADII